MEENPDTCPWYDDNIKKINKKIWFPNKVKDNDKHIYKFDSNVIDFESSIPINHTNTLKIKVPVINDIEQDTYKCKLSHQLKILTLIGKYKKISTEYYKDPEKYINENEKYDNKKELIKFQAKNRRLLEKHPKQLKLIGKEVHAHKIKLNLNNSQKNIIKNWMKESEKVYNYCVKQYNTNKDFPKNFMGAKLVVFKDLYADKIRTVPYDIITYEVKDFFSNLQSAYSNLENKNIKFFEMSYKNTKKQQTITIYKNCISKNGIYTTLLGKIKGFTDQIDSNDIMCDSKLTYDKITNNYYFYVPSYVNCANSSKEKKSICAIDPGEKVPFTYYSTNDYGLIGNDIRKDILKFEAKIRKFQRLLNNREKKDKTKTKKIKKGKIIKRINMLYRKIKGLVNELHKKAALFFCKNYNIILIPKFETQKMICDKKAIKKKVFENITDIKEKNKDNVTELKKELKVYKRKRRLNSRVKFVLQQMSHYKFKQHLFSKAKEYGCLCIEVTEEYTSQLCAKCGKLDKTYVNRMKKCKHCKQEINRDVNGSRNILLKYISSFVL